jgi:DNA mismatch repair ATPase MutS
MKKSQLQNYCKSIRAQANKTVPKCSMTSRQEKNGIAEIWCDFEDQEFSASNIMNSESFNNFLKANQAKAILIDNRRIRIAY